MVCDGVELIKTSNMCDFHSCHRHHNIAFHFVHCPWRSCLIEPNSMNRAKRKNRKFSSSFTCLYIHFGRCCVSRKVCATCWRSRLFWEALNRVRLLAKIFEFFFRGSNNVCFCFNLILCQNRHFEVKSKVVHTPSSNYIFHLIGIDSQESCDRYTWFVRKLAISSHFFFSIW